ncbi:MAG: hypothetical protein FWC24_07135, partial [Treponema sp.]|nr:hypothetical protein [Treponema sp.]
MIVPMKKVSLVVMEKERDITLEKLRKVGVVHLRKKNVSSDRLEELLEKRARTGQALGALSRYPVKEGPAPEIQYFPPNIAAFILGLVEEKGSLQEELAFLLGERRRVAAWGDFDPDDFDFLGEHGIKLFLYSLPTPIYKRVGDSAKLIILSMDKRWVKAAAVGAEIPGLHPFTLPDHSLSELDDYIDANRWRIREIEDELSCWAHNKKIIEGEISRILEDIEYETARAGMGSLEDGSAQIAIAWLTGFVPDDSFEELKSAAEENGWTFMWE